MPKSAARRRKQPQARPSPPAARAARSLFPSSFTPDEESPVDVDYAADLDEEADEPSDVASPSGSGRGYVRTATLRQGRVPYLLRDVIESRHEIAQAERLLAKRVRAARDHGASWEDIGVALGMSRQGAAKKFG
jgi:hypothetical protein